MRAAPRGIGKPDRDICHSTVRLDWTAIRNRPPIANAGMPATMIRGPNWSVPMSRSDSHQAASQAVPPPAANPLDPDLLQRMDAWWRAANYLSTAPGPSKNDNTILGKTQ